MEYVVSPVGVESNDGSAASPWTLSKGISMLQPGDVLYLRGGTYVGRVVLQGRVATPSNPIVIRSFPEEHAILDGALSDFREVPNDRWVPGETLDEYVSMDPYPHVGNDARGSFLDRTPYTRLISYWTLKDLQATNQRFGPIANTDPLDGPEAASPKDSNLPRLPWVYMGPGLFQDDSGHVRIRLSPTNNNLPGFPDYAGENDPRELRLAIWTSRQGTLLVSGCESVYISDITVRHGAPTVRIENSTDTRLDHVRVLAGSYGVEFGPNCNGTVMTHCLIDGGMPPWYFRSDRKDPYTYLLNGAEVTNGLGQNTVKALLHGNKSCKQTKIRYCEFVNGHDLYLFGTGLEFSRNWVSNLNDDAIVAEAEGIDDLKIFENVIEKSLTAINFAGTKPGNGVFVYRNLFDLRSPTAGIRPRPNDATESLRLGHLFKGRFPDGPLDLFQNTILVKDQTIGSSFAHFRGYKGESSRRSFNNIFVAMNDVPLADKPITYLPNPTFPAATDGNCYYRTGQFKDGPLLHHDWYMFPDDAGVRIKGGNFDSLEELRGDPPHQASSIFIHSQSGFEESSIATDPRFRHFDPTQMIPSDEDDFRLRWDSPARQQGIVLPDELRTLDNAQPNEAPDIGCFRLSAPPLSVGVDARRDFPQTPAPAGNTE